jgi:hypothetical protein
VTTATTYRFSSYYGTEFGDNTDDVAPAIPDGWEVSKPWQTSGDDGWQYANDFQAETWFPTNNDHGSECKYFNGVFVSYIPKL